MKDRAIAIALDGMGMRWLESYSASRDAARRLSKRAETEPCCEMVGTMSDRVRIEIRIEPVFVDGMSWGTITHVHVLREECEIGLAAAKDIVDRLVYGGETVVVDVRASRVAGLLAKLAAIPSPPIMHVSVLSGSDPAT